MLPTVHRWHPHAAVTEQRMGVSSGRQKDRQSPLPANPIVISTPPCSRCILLRFGTCNPYGEKITTAAHHMRRCPLQALQRCQDSKIEVQQLLQTAAMKWGMAGSLIGDGKHACSASLRIAAFCSQVAATSWHPSRFPSRFGYESCKNVSEASSVCTAAL